MIKLFVNRIEKEIRNFIKTIQYDSDLIQNLNYNCIDNQRKCLICYKTTGFYFDIDSKRSHTLLFEIHKIISVFAQLGYTVDIIDPLAVNGIKLIKEKKYDVIFGFGEVFYQMTNLQQDAISIYYFTENYPYLSFRAERERIDYFYERHHRRAKIVRSGKFYKQIHLSKKYNGVIVLGESEPFLTQYPKIYSIFPTGLINSNFIYSNKNHEETRKHFLWFGTNAVIHKGLDLLVDIFSQRDDVVLHICGTTKRADNYLRIPKKANIILYGKIDVNGETFLKLIETCSYTIFPSCSEGFATSITTCMLHGLIPIVYRSTGFNRLKNNALFLDDYKIEYINEKITEYSEISTENLNIYSKSIFDFARQNFVISKFNENFREIVTEILETND